MASAQGPVSLVTGSARGLGLAVARELAARGDRVHVVWRSSAERAAALEAEFPGRLHRADLTDPSAARSLVDAVGAADGRLDRVVHAVGDFVVGDLEELDVATLKDLFASNVETAWNLVAAARGPVRAARGTWLFFGCAGIAGLRARRRTAGYAAVKTALAVLARSLAVEEAPHGVRVNTVSPGVVPHDGAHPDTFDAARVARIPLGRVGTPEDVARAAAWLLSDASGYATGQDLEIAGGWLL